MRNDILECSVFHMESSWDYAKLYESEFPIQGECAFVRLDNGIELQNAESAFLSLDQGMPHEHFSDVVPRHSAETA